MRLRRGTLVALLLLALAAVEGAAHGQGCSQCREAVGQTPAQTQTGYRRGIATLALAAIAVFAGTGLVLRRYR